MGRPIGYGCLLRLESTSRGGSSSGPFRVRSYSYLADAIFKTESDAKKAACLQALCVGGMSEFVDSLTRKHGPSASTSSASADPLIKVTERMEQDFLDAWHNIQTACLQKKVALPEFHYHGPDHRRGQ